MAKLDPRIDAYIDNSAEFARPILRQLREVVHRACPEVEEDLKWSRPHFGYRGIMCGMSAFRAHCTFGFWNDRVGGDDPAARETLERLGRITSAKELPPKKVLAGLVKRIDKRLRVVSVSDAASIQKVAEALELR